MQDKVYVEGSTSLFFGSLSFVQCMSGLHYNTHFITQHEHFKGWTWTAFPNCYLTFRRQNQNKEHQSSNIHSCTPLFNGLWVHWSIWATAKKWQLPDAMRHTHEVTVLIVRNGTYTPALALGKLLVPVHQALTLQLQNCYWNFLQTLYYINKLQTLMWDLFRVL